MQLRAPHARCVILSEAKHLRPAGKRLACGTLVLLLAACAGPQRAALDAGGDGPGKPALAEAADAEPRIEPIRPGGPNKPYRIGGQDYVPITHELPFRERGLASWYGAKFHGRRTAGGEVYDMHAITAAHPTLPIPSYARIRNPANGREVVVRINDRGPFVAGRIVDLSYAAALRLDLLRGLAPVELERLSEADIRALRLTRESVLVARPMPEGVQNTNALPSRCHPERSEGSRPCDPRFAHELDRD